MKMEQTTRRPLLLPLPLSRFDGVRIHPIPYRCRPSCVPEATNVTLVPRQTPYEAITSALRGRLGDALTTRLPHRWERLGDALVLRLPAELLVDAHREPIARAYAHALGARLVLQDTRGVQGDLRQPTMQVLLGDPPHEVTHLENGIRYTLDPTRIMWSGGNVDERIRMARIDAQNDTVVDLFAGIGYYTLPLLVHAQAQHVHACDLNPDSIHYLAHNAQTHEVADRLTIHRGDCQDVAPHDIADRVLMGYFPYCHRFLMTALASLKPEGGIIHYHDTVKAGQESEELAGHMQDAIAAHNAHTTKPYQLDQHDTHHVKSFAPGVTHAVLDATLSPLH